MKPIGSLMLVLGLLGSCVFLVGYDVSVPAATADDPARRVANLERMSTRQTGIVFTGLIAVVGVIMVVGAGRGRSGSQLAKRIPGGKVCPECGLISPTSADRCDCGMTI